MISQSLSPNTAYVSRDAVCCRYSMTQEAGDVQYWGEPGCRLGIQISWDDAWKGPGFRGIMCEVPGGDSSL